LALINNHNFLIKSFFIYTFLTLYIYIYISYLKYIIFNKLYLIILPHMNNQCLVFSIYNIKFIYSILLKRLDQKCDN